MARIVISAVNRKGGCSKTGSIFHLAGEYATRGLRVLVIDCDPQASLSQGFFGPQVVESLPKGNTVAALFDDSLCPKPEDLIRPTPFERLFVVPGSDYLTEYNLPHPWKTGPLTEALTEFVREVGDRFDAILFDNPPNLQLCSWAALAASDYVFTPLAPEDFSAMGIIHVQKFIEQVVTRQNPRLHWLGLVITMFQSRLSVHITYDQMLTQLYQSLVFSTKVPLAASFKEAVARRTPMSHFKPKSAPAKAIKALATEIEERAGKATEAKQEAA
jgi:chromosome partitioning protein